MPHKCTHHHLLVERDPTALSSAVIAYSGGMLMRVMSITVLTAALMATACSGFVAVETRPPDRPVVVHESRPVHPAHLGIPPGHLPPPGQCRIWIPERPPGHQQPPGRCSALETHTPLGAWLVYRPSHDRKHVEVSVFDVDRPRLVVAVGIYEVSTGRFVRDVR